MGHVSWRGIVHFVDYIVSVVLGAKLSSWLLARRVVLPWKCDSGQGSLNFEDLISLQRCIVSADSDLLVKKPNKFSNL